MNTINAKDFKMMLSSGVANLSNHKQEIDRLNVFPVPDGDTGTNMLMTVENGFNEAKNINEESVSAIAKAFSKGLLMGARGNSGVITSQIFRGFAQGVENKDTIDVLDIAIGFENGARIAYKAIMKPVEGTILTVIRESSWYAKHDLLNNSDIDINHYFDLLYKYAKESLERTPTLLPTLKEAGVVDSGGAGLVRIIEGFKAYVDGKPFEYQEVKEENKTLPSLDLDDDNFGYCTEFILRLDDKHKNLDENILKRNLSNVGGESLVVVKDDDLIKVHVHMFKPGDALNIAQRYGEFVKLKVENMSEQHSSIIANQEKRYGIIAVASGKGIEDLLVKSKVDIVIKGGQTMNPSTQDFVNEVKKLGNCKHVLIFPNNSNIILAAKQVEQVFTDRRVHVVETKSIPACISCLSYFDPEGHLLDNLAEFERINKNIEDASITYAVKDTSFENIEVKEGDYIAIYKKQIIASNKDKNLVINKLLDEFKNNLFAELLTIYVGEDGSVSEANKMKAYVESNSDIEVMIFEGNQPVYSYLFGLE